jgi:hypothetical protein
MQIRVPVPELVIELRDLLRRAGCIAAQTGPDTLQVTVPDAPNAEQERREVEAYLARWTAANGVQAELLDD